MSVVERYNRIIKIVSLKGKVRIIELSKNLGVSSMTILRDLKILEEQGKLHRVSGWAIAKPDINTRENNFFQRVQQNKTEKMIIAKEALNFISPDDTIILDASSTVYYLAKLVKNIKGLTVITNSIPILNEMIFNSEVYVIATGGELRMETASLDGPYALRSLKDLKADKFFLSTLALNFNDGLMEPNLAVAEIKKYMLSISKENILLVDNTKFINRAMVSMCSINAINKVIVDSKIDPDSLDLMRNSNVEVIVCSNEDID